MTKNSRTATKLIHAGHKANEYQSIITPLYQSSVFAFENISEKSDLFDSESESFVYTRLANPTVRAFEDAVCVLENAYRGVATASGMAALNAVIFAFAQAGKHILCSESVYGSTRSVIENDWTRFGVESDFIDTSEIENIENQIKANTAIVYIETPSNPLLKITDIRKAADIAHKHGALLVADNTFAGPVFQNPLTLGADIVIHSVTKYINGHSDVVGGMVLASNQQLFEKIHHAMIYSGGNMDPHQAFLAHRGLKTLGLRMKKAEENALAIAHYLQKHKHVEAVHYPGLKTHPGHETAKKQMTGFSSVLSFELSGGLETGMQLINSLELIIPAVSLGGVESFIQHPASMTHSNVKPEERFKSGITDGLIRMAVGIEDIEDLLNDLKAALDKL
jgi:methionine-gamma-lyase